MDKEITIPIDEGKETTAVIYRAESPSRPATLILAHGAGAGQRHPFMVAFARGLSARGLDVVTFDFEYTYHRKRVPDRMPQLVACYRAVLAAVPEYLESAREHLFIGGKSMGGRVATHLPSVLRQLPTFEGSALPFQGIVLLGYPLHPPGRLDQQRDAHLPDVKIPMLFVQGSRDAFGTPSELARVIEMISAAGSPPSMLHAVEGGDHSFRISGRNAARQEEAYRSIQNAIVTWILRGE